MMNATKLYENLDYNNVSCVFLCVSSGFDEIKAKPVLWNKHN